MAEQHDELATKKDLDQLKQELVAKIDGNGAKIDANSAKIDQVEQSLTAKIDANGAKIDEVEQRLTARLDKLTDYAIENRERLGKMLTEEKFKVYFNELMNNIDGLARSVSRGEQERTAMNARLGRMESDVEGLKAKLGT
jgi:chromosome segregation ATPase